VRRPARRGAAVLAALLLAACGTPAPPSRPVTLVFEHSHVFGPRDPLPDLVRRFEAAHPGVAVVSEELPANTDDAHQLYVINLEGRTAGFDVMMLDVIWIPEFARAGWLLDLSGAVPPEELGAHFPAAVAPATWGGRVWALPWTMNTGVLYYRADLLAKYGLPPPATWQALADDVRRIRAGERDPRLDGYLWQGKQYEGMMVNVAEALWGAGTELLGPDGRVFPDPARAAEALAWQRSLLTGGVSPAWVTAADEELTRRAFGDGHAIFLRNWPYALDLFERPGSPVRGRVGIAPLPGRTPATAGIGATGGSHLAVSARTRHPEAAVALARFLTGEAAQRAMTGAFYPTRRLLYHDPALIREHPALPALYRLMLAARPRPITPSYLLVSSALQPDVSAVLVGLRAPDRALADARRRVDYFLASRR
jgi:multiple sugar transport system substrate-binding protein